LKSRLLAGLAGLALVAASLAACSREPSTPTPTPTPGPPVPARYLADRPPVGPGAEIGEPYPFSLYVHCGVRDTYFDGRRWMANPRLDDGSGNPPPGWTHDDSNGEMTLVSEDHAVFKSRSGRTIEFTSWPEDVEWSPCF